MKLKDSKTSPNGLVCECGKDKADENTFAKSLEKLIRMQEQESKMAVLVKGNTSFVTSIFISLLITNNIK